MTYRLRQTFISDLYAREMFARLDIWSGQVEIAQSKAINSLLRRPRYYSENFVVNDNIWRKCHGWKNTFDKKTKILKTIRSNAILLLRETFLYEFEKIELSYCVPYDFEWEKLTAYYSILLQSIILTKYRHINSKTHIFQKIFKTS